MQQAAHESVAYAETYDRAFNGDRAGYLKEVDALMEELSGVRYMDVSNSIHPAFEAYKDAFDRGVLPLAFVKDTMRDFGFIQVGKIYGAVDAAGFNLIKAAMCEFASVNPEWKRGRDGTLFHETVEGVATMRPVRDKNSSRWGFGIEMREGAALDAHQTHIVSDGTVSGQYGAFDIGPVVDSYKTVHQSSKKFNF